MAGNSSRNKGYRGEREAIAILQPVVDKVCRERDRVPPILKRNLHQRFQPHQCDVDGIPWMALEVKRVENQSGIGSWWKQCLAATRPGQTPVLLYRPNNQPWKIRMRVPVLAGKTKITCTVNMDLPSFLVWFEQRLKWEMR